MVAGLLAALLAALVGGAVLLLGPADAPPAGDVALPASASPEGTPSAAPEPTAADACRYVVTGEPARPVGPPGPVPAAGPGQDLVARVRTTAGDLELELDAAAAPCAVHSLRHLADAGFYAGTPCHRLVTRGVFALHCGDPTGTGRGGPGYAFAEEALAQARYPRGTVAMVNSGPGTTGSQLFLFYADSALPPQYTPLGRLTPASLEVLDVVAAAGAGPPDELGSTPPLMPVQLLELTVAPARPEG